MISKKKRVNSALFQKVMKKGRVIHSPFFIFRYLDQENPQYSFVVPKSLSKRAVFRNQKRRIGYNILKNIDILGGVGIFFYKKDGVLVETNILKDDIIKILKKVKKL
ncbi:TPA: hypothetical protein DIC38_00770 [Candidatus Nomurabacteria bacterium]|nr:MAG: hypothetical protein O210_OD1C00001G0573 [Parcubacteria bacterium RAAC4_OD1_1]HCY26204.1 hypothetical protein [Candidatus Nomurabacteria bacterium]